MKKIADIVDDVTGAVFPACLVVLIMMVAFLTIQVLETGRLPW